MAIQNEEDLRKIVSGDPGNPAFVDLAEILRRRGSWCEALEVSLTGLSKNPTCHQGRLVLARIFYDRHWYGFAVREIEALREALPQSKSIARLLEKLAPGAASAAPSVKGPGEVVAETEFDFDALEMIDESNPNTPEKQ